MDVATVRLIQEEPLPTAFSYQDSRLSSCPESASRSPSPSTSPAAIVIKEGPGAVAMSGWRTKQAVSVDRLVAVPVDPTVVGLRGQKILVAVTVQVGQGDENVPSPVVATVRTVQAVPLPAAFSSQTR